MLSAVTRRRRGTAVSLQLIALCCPLLFCGCQSGSAPMIYAEGRFQSRAAAARHSRIRKKGVRVSLAIRELPAAERPRERLRSHGAHAMSSSELLAILLGSGSEGRSA